jgi:hypothetical protein
MAQGTQDARLKLSAEEEAHLVTLDHNQMIAYLHELEVAKGLTVPDVLNGSVFHEITPVETPPAASDVKTVTINGTVVSGTQAQIDEAMRAAFTKSQSQDDQPARDSNGRFKKETPAEQRQKEELAVAERAELDLQFKRGQIDTATYLEKTGAIAEALEKTLGVPLNQIVDSFQEHAGKSFEQSWAEASNKFKQSPEGRTWPGGEANKLKLGEVMTTTEVEGVLLADLPDKVQALRLAYDYMKDNDLLVENTETKQEQTAALEKQITAAKSPEEIAQILGVNDRRVAAAQSAMWGKS